jgi:hypothetical protein
VKRGRPTGCVATKMSGSVFFEIFKFGGYMKCLVHEMTNRAALLYGVLGVAEYMPHRVVLNAASVANRTHETLTFVLN